MWNFDCEGVTAFYEEKKKIRAFMLIRGFMCMTLNSTILSGLLVINFIVKLMEI